MDSRTKSSLLWGLVGAFAFLVLAQGYHLTGGEFLGVAPMMAGAVVVLGVTTAIAQRLRPRLAENESP